MEQVVERESLVFTVMLRNNSFVKEFLSRVLIMSKLFAAGIIPGNECREFL
jgi:hypothetical protein